MKKILKFEVEEGVTRCCKSCPLSKSIETDYGEDYVCENGLNNILDCEKYNLLTLKFLKDEN